MPYVDYQVTGEQKLLAILAHLAYFLGGIGFVIAPLVIFILKKTIPSFMTMQTSPGSPCVASRGQCGSVPVMFLLIGFYSFRFF